MVACHFTYKNVLLPTFEIWDAFLPEGWHSYLHEDNQAMERIIQTGRNPTMKTLPRCHGVNINFLHERLSDSAGEGADRTPNRDPCTLKDCGSDTMAADIYTKAFSNDEKWEAACRLINIIDEDKLTETFAHDFDPARVENSFDQKPKVATPDGDEHLTPSAGAPKTTCAQRVKKSTIDFFRPPKTVQNAEENKDIKNLWFANVFGGAFNLAKSMCKHGLGVRRLGQSINRCSRL